LEQRGVHIQAEQRSRTGSLKMLMAAFNPVSAPIEATLILPSRHITTAIIASGRNCITLKSPATLS